VLLFVRVQPPELAPIDVVRLLRDQVALRSRDVELDGVRVIDDLDRLPIIQADGRQLGQALANILDNALDALRTLPPDRDRTIRLGASSESGCVRLRIETAGPPIAGEALSRIFDPFYTTKAVGRGIGLGLSVSLGIVSAHGGRIVAENLPRGVAIAVELPVTGFSCPPGAS